MATANISRAKIRPRIDYWALCLRATINSDNRDVAGCQLGRAGQQTPEDLVAPALGLPQEWHGGENLGKSAAGLVITEAAMGFESALQNVEEI